MVGIDLNPYDDDFSVIYYWYVNYECCIATSAVLSLGKDQCCWGLRVLLERLCWVFRSISVSHEWEWITPPYAIYKYNVIAECYAICEYYAYEDYASSAA
jgi:hypothetical protein